MDSTSLLPPTSQEYLDISNLQSYERANWQDILPFEQDGSIVNEKQYFDYLPSSAQEQGNQVYFHQDQESHPSCQKGYIKINQAEYLSNPLDNEYPNQFQHGESILYQLPSQAPQAFPADPSSFHYSQEVPAAYDSSCLTGSNECQQAKLPEQVKLYHTLMNNSSSSPLETKHQALTSSPSHHVQPNLLSPAPTFSSDFPPPLVNEHASFISSSDPNTDHGDAYRCVYTNCTYAPLNTAPIDNNIILENHLSYVDSNAHSHFPSTPSSHSLSSSNSIESPSTANMVTTNTNMTNIHHHHSPPPSCANIMVIHPSPSDEHHTYSNSCYLSDGNQDESIHTSISSEVISSVSSQDSSLPSASSTYYDSSTSYSPSSSTSNLISLNRNQELDNMPSSHYTPLGHHFYNQFQPLLLETGPGTHQIKEYNIRPVNTVKINFVAASSDIVIVKLLCDQAMKLKDPEIFLTALSPKYHTDELNKLYFPSLKISKDMLRGRTKGYKFHLVFSLNTRGQEAYRVLSDAFYLWTNVNQIGFPRDERDSYLNSVQYPSTNITQKSESISSNHHYRSYFAGTNINQQHSAKTLSSILGEQTAKKRKAS